MRTSVRALVVSGTWLCAASVLSATPPLTPASLRPCAFSLAEVAVALGVQLQRTDDADMTLPVGRDVGCLYSIKGSDFVFGVRQTWDSTRPGSAAAQSVNGFTRIAGDPDGAMFASDTASGSGGELVYTRGKVQIRVFWHGGNLTSADGLARLLRLRRLP
jgi:hypothetical protein